MQTLELNRKNLLDTINGYGWVVDMPNSEARHCLGSLSRILILLELVQQLSSSEHIELAKQATTTREAINARERINGTEIERADPDNFRRLTETTRDELVKLKSLATASFWR